MKHRPRPLLLALLLFIPAAALLRAQEKAAPKAPETELHKLMENNNGHWRKLRRQAADPANNAASAALVVALREGLTKALALTPAKADDVPAADREKFIAAYQTRLKEFIVQLDLLEAAFKANDNAGAQALIAKLGAMQKEDHKEFRRPEKD